jgi:hypothetical protein
MAIHRMSFRIPPGEREYMAALVQAKLQLLDSIEKALKGCTPALMSDDLSTALAKKLVGTPGFDEKTIDAVVRTLFAVYIVLRTNNLSSAAESAAQVVETVRKEPDVYGEPPEGWDAFEHKLQQLLDDEVLGLSAKAVAVSSETVGHVHSVRVLTDARPIFSNDANEGPKAFAIIHTLKIDYFGEGRNREWFMALDGDDLENLQIAVERALEKERSLRSTLQRLETPVLSWKVGDGE